MDAADLLNFDLDESERRLLRSGIVEWSGPARCTEEMAVAMGFGGVRELFDSTRRLADAIQSGDPLPAADWLRLLLATEVVFASNVLGSGLDWTDTTGMSDEDSVITLRSVQRKLSSVGALIGRAFGTRYP